MNKLLFVNGYHIGYANSVEEVGRSIQRLLASTRAPSLSRYQQMDINQQIKNQLDRMERRLRGIEERLAPGNNGKAMVTGRFLSRVYGLKRGDLERLRKNGTVGVERTKSGGLRYDLEMIKKQYHAQG